MSQFRKLMTALGLPEMIEHELTSSHSDRILNRVFIVDTIGEAVSKQDRTEVVAAVAEAGVPCAPVI